MPAAQHLTNGHGFHKSGIVFGMWTFVVAAAIWGCAPQTSITPEQQAAAFVAEHTKGAIDGSAQKAGTSGSAQLPVRYQTPSYMLKAESGAGVTASTDVGITVGAKITPAGPKPLHLVMQELAKLKAMNVSWANDVDKDALVNVTIMPDEDFFEAIDSVLRQLDYFHAMDGNTIVIKHKETKKFHITMPFITSTYSTGVGGDVLGKTQGSNMSGTLNLNSNDNKYDIWSNIEKNLDKILEIWSAPPAPVVAAADTPAAGGAAPAAPAAAPPAKPAAASAENSGHSGRGYYTVDRSIGLITVTAPRSVIVKIENYINNLCKEVYRQVSIEAKIIEVTLNSDNTTGLDWQQLSTLGLRFNFQDISLSQGGTLNTNHDSTMLSPLANFDVMIDVMKQQGHVEVLSNPKISVMNGQPAMLSIGDNIKYISKITSTVAENSPTVTTAETESLLSGLALGVVASIGDDNNIVLNLTPVTTKLQSMDVAQIGANKDEISLPKINIREMSTTVRIKDGEMLVVGGLIDNKDTYDNNYVAGLGELPGTGGKLFRKDGTVTEKKELIILMRPKIISL